MQRAADSRQGRHGLSAIGGEAIGAGGPGRGGTGSDATSSLSKGTGEHYPIGTLARLADVSTRTLRYYEEIGLLRTARRFAAGRRVFDGDALQRLRFIGRLKRLGFSLDEISHLNEVFALSRSTAEMLKVLDAKLAGHVAGLDEQMRELSALRGDLTSYRQHIRARLRHSPKTSRRHGAGAGNGKSNGSRP